MSDLRRLNKLERLSKRYSPYRLWAVTVWEWLKGGKSMSAPKTFFEQIPIEMVKRIATQFSGESAMAIDGGNTEMRDEVRAAPIESWRDVAEKVQHEPDSKRVVELVQKMIVMLDEEERRRRSRRLASSPTSTV